jgi:putative SOS response-associated peptidase YedK
MCGRSSLHDAPVNILDRFGLPPVLPGFKPRYNIAPTQEQWTLGLDAKGEFETRQRRWGLIPSWANDPSIGSRLINARAESIDQKPAFRDAFQARRCLILADGYYEWKGEGKSKIPMFFHLAGHRAFPMAGLWEWWRRDDEIIETCIVVTTDASKAASAIHPRMPVILSLDAAADWLDRSTTPRAALELLVPYEKADLEWHEVSRMVNNAAVDSPACIERASESAQPTISQLSLLPD